MYTGHVVEDDVVTQTQCIAVSDDGINFEKLASNPVIGAELLGDEGSIHDFRDPKVFQHEGTYYSVVATKTNDNRGKIVLFSSEDLNEWSFFSVLLEGTKEQGIMWECPDFFTLDGKDVLIMSPIQIKRQGHEYHNINR
jgi:beta-fructofuranosidase